jgi:hypothetical protein
MKSKAKRIKQIQENLLESHKMMIGGYMSYERYLSIEKDAKQGIKEIRQEDTLKNKIKVSCEDCANLIIQGYGRSQYVCKFKHNKVRGVFNLFSYDCKDKQEK